MPIVMEKKDWMQTVANVGASDGVWFENVSGNAGSISVSLSEGGRYQVILVKIDSLPTKTLQPRKSSSVAGNCKNRVMKIGSMRGEVVLPDNFDQAFEGLDDRMLVARAEEDGLRLLSHDGKLPPYGDFVEHV